MTGLYRPDYEHDSCGFGLVAQMDGVASHALVHTAIDSLSRLTHRGAVAADGKTGDGCGLLLRTPDKHLRAIAAETGLTLARRYAVGMVFFNRDAALRHTAMQALVSELKAQDLEVAGWRRVPVDPDACGEQALASLPEVRQVFVNAPQGMEAQEFDRRLFIARRRAVKAADPGDKAFHVASLASRAILYKGLVMPHNLARFYTDLGDPRLESAIAVFHQRFSTNTWPEWRLAQPFRYLAHNGEINTIKSNRNWAEARSYKFHTPLIPDLDAIRPWVSATGSDSFSLDNMLEALLMGGMDLFRAMRLLIPPAWQDAKTMDPDLRAFFEYGSMHQEPWDGPAGIVLTDGRYAACVMDRNGLRPARYVITNDRHITLASEAGVNDHAPGEIVAKGRLQPGEMLAVDTRTGELLPGTEIDARLKARKPYRRWLERHAEHLDTASDEEETLAAAIGDTDRLTIYKKLFHITFEEKDQLLRVLAEAGQEAVGSMGDDTPLPVMSREIRSLYDSFRQQFAQVTNPPIDSLRERLVMSLQTCIGRERNLFEETPDHARRLVVDSPVLGATAFAALKKHPYAADAQHTLDLNYAESRNLETAIRDLCDQAVQAVRDGAVILILSDRAIREGFLPVHALLATGAVHHRLISEGLRCDANIVVETATARDPHHFAVLLGYGATAVYPYLAYATLAAMVDSAHIKDRRVAEALTAYRHGIDKGILKILSKMGISTVASYRGAQLFEAVGLADQVVEQCFSGTPSRLQGMGFKELEADQRQLARHAWHRHRPIMHGGLLKFAHKGEYHGFNPDVVHALHQAVEQQDYGKYLEYARLVNTRPHSALRDLLVFDHRVEAIDVNQVEPIEAILPRFETGAMSLGALSPEAHETLAVAMNRLGGRSNSGEGGEDAARFGTEKNSRIKQVASGRFGVTPEYLVSAEVLQIKIAQGAKPGEGGQLAGRKVNALIARLRHCNPGTPLISPPPHHDIYSIEDLAQLIFDLKQVNPQAFVSVKLVAEPGVGTVAAGVAKAYADMITVSGHDGGTGASPVTSVRYAGSPWELGLAETHQTLRCNDLRGRVRLQTDGGIRTGLDVVKAAMLGAESFGVGTTALLALGCKYLRICHLNTCATGVATQDEHLRKKHFKGDADKAMALFRFMAEETREWMARLGVRTLNELVGRVDLLRAQAGTTARQQGLDLGLILSNGGADPQQPRYCVQPRNPPYDRAELAESMVRDALPAIEAGSGGDFRYELRNDNRSIGARLSGEIARRHGDNGMEGAPIVLRLRGTAGQSFGAWNAGGLHLYLEGDANDYVGKGMAGGRLVIYPPCDSRFLSARSVIMGNTCLYGATGGRLFAAGLAGERFAVRNSGAFAVVEGAGDHACEYMTGGLVAVLGNVGFNFAAGMTGGLAFVLDRENSFPAHLNSELVESHRLTGPDTAPQAELLRDLIAEHVAETGSRWGQRVLDNFDALLPSFWLVKPKGQELSILLEQLSCAA